MVTLTIRIFEISSRIDTIDGAGNSVSVKNVTFKVVEWPELGPWTLSIPVTYTKAQAKTAIENYVRTLAINTHEWYGFEWSMTV